MSNLLYAAIVVFTEKHVISYEEVKNDDCFFFNDLHIRIKVLCVQNGFIRFKLYDFSKQNIPIGCFGIPLNEPILFEGLIVEPGEISFYYRDCYIVFSNSPVDIDKRNYNLGFVISNNEHVSNLETIKAHLRANNRIEEFKEMSFFCDNDPELYKSTRQLEKNTRIYREGFLSKRSPKQDTLIFVEENLTLTTAKRFADYDKKVAVLNFANPVEPGGGILRGANAQEEYLCRLSNLYKSLSSKNAEKYYSDNNKIRSNNQFNSMFIGTDQVIYSPDVTVLKKSDAINREWFREMYADDYYTVDVLTCAAPFFSGSGYIIPNGDLKYLLMRRIKNIFEVAIENNIDVLVLGAFGCGAFHNPPEVVASAFKDCLRDARYSCAFDEVVFAIKRESTPSKNIQEFKKAFSKKPTRNNAFSHFSCFNADGKTYDIDGLENYLTEQRKNPKIKEKLRIGDVVKLQGRDYEVVIEYVDYEVKDIGKVDYAGKRADGLEPNSLSLINQYEIEKIIRKHSDEE